MRKQDELADRESCLNQAEAEEPIFVLRGHDPLAPEIVREWADAYARAKAGALTPPRAAKLAEARALADAMDDWYDTHVLETELAE